MLIITITIMRTPRREAQPKIVRMTRQRRAILDALEKSRSHPTAHQVHQMVRRRLSQISLATVYRNLELLADQGLIQKLELGGAQMRFDGSPAEHYHVRCVSCGRVDDVAARPPISIRRAARRVKGYQILGHRLELIGLCARCKTRKRRSHQEAPAARQKPKP
jgi:Fur family ferric uptake transcriptional regulator